MKPKLIFLDEPTSGLAPWPYLEFHEGIYRGSIGRMENKMETTFGLRDDGRENGNYLKSFLFRV